MTKVPTLAECISRTCQSLTTDIIDEKTLTVIFCGGKLSASALLQLAFPELGFTQKQFNSRAQHAEFKIAIELPLTQFLSIHYPKRFDPTNLLFTYKYSGLSDGLLVELATEYRSFGDLKRRNDTLAKTIIALDKHQNRQIQNAIMTAHSSYLTAQRYVVSDTVTLQSFPEVLVYHLLTKLNFNFTYDYASSALGKKNPYSIDFVIHDEANSPLLGIEVARNCHEKKDSASIAYHQRNLKKTVAYRENEDFDVFFINSNQPEVNFFNAVITVLSQEFGEDVGPFPTLDVCSVYQKPEYSKFLKMEPYELIEYIVERLGGVSELINQHSSLHHFLQRHYSNANLAYDQVYQQAKAIGKTKKTARTARTRKHRSDNKYAAVVALPQQKLITYLRAQGYFTRYILKNTNPALLRVLTEYFGSEVDGLFSKLEVSSKSELSEIRHYFRSLHLDLSSAQSARNAIKKVPHLFSVKAFHLNYFSKRLYRTLKERNDYSLIINSL